MMSQSCFKCFYAQLFIFKTREKKEVCIKEKTTFICEKAALCTWFANAFCKGNKKSWCCDRGYMYYRKEPATLEEDLVKSAADLVALLVEKQKAYGDSFEKAGGVLEILYPDGAKLEQYTDMLAITRVIDKLFRIANRKDAFQESPWKDIAGYALLSAVKGAKDVE